MITSEKTETEGIKEELKNLPVKPGCYLFYDAQGKLLYVGKASSLKDRVSQYFRKGNVDYKTRKLASRIQNIEYVLTASEYEALILEQNLIKNKKPIFNILLTDSKKYPYIQLTNTKHPKFEIKRTINPKRGIYFGPITLGGNARLLKEILDLLYPFRKCNRLPTKKCFYYDLGQCLAPCINKIALEDYLPMYREVKRIFSGDIDFLIKKFKEKLDGAIEKENYQLAKKWNSYLEGLDTFKMERSEFRDLHSHHAIGYQEKDGIQVFFTSFYLGGRWMGSTYNFREKGIDIKDDFEEFLMSFYQSTPIPEEIIISDDYDLENVSKALKTKITYPKAGFKKTVIKRVILNANEILEKKLPEWKRQKTIRTQGHMELEKVVGRDIYSIMMVDNSHISLTNFVSAYVTFIEGVPNKSNYRYVNLEDAGVRDDTEGMYLSVTKRFRNYENDEASYCDLLIVDGAMGQLNAAKRAMKDLGLENVTVVAIAKDDYHKASKLVLKKGSEIILEHGNLLRYLSTIQDESHRFANSYLQNKRQKQLMENTSSKIAGIGPMYWGRLIKRYQTIENIKLAPFDELKDLLPEKVARSVFSYFNIEGNSVNGGKND